MKCKWIYDKDYDFWGTDCGSMFQIIDGTPKENDMKFCPYCGNQIQGKQ